MPNPTLGEIRIFAGNFAPRDWMFCDGSKVPTSQYTALFSLLGTTYGGDGKTYFQLPDLRGRIMVGVGAGPGLWPYGFGKSGGQETVHMQPDQVPKHTHKFLAASAAADSPSPEAASFGTVASDALLYTNTAKQTTMPRRQFSPQAVGPSGGSPMPEPHENMMSSVALNFIISMLGVYPSKPN
jgi:microcystin-dependent protein